jgi:chaperonin GroES
LGFWAFIEHISVADPFLPHKWGVHRVRKKDLTSNAAKNGAQMPWPSIDVGTLPGIVLSITEEAICLLSGSNKETNMALQPLHDRIIVEAAAKEQTSAGGIILPDTAQEKPQRGTVLAVGPGKRLDSGQMAPVDVKVGDTVLYGKYGGTEVTVDGKDYVIIRAEEILAVLEDSKVAVGAGA